MRTIFSEIRDERANQDVKWGKQNHPVFQQSGDFQHRLWKELRARERCEERMQEGRLSWYDILIEEACEVNGAADDEEARKELVQLAAVAVAAIECIDRRRMNTTVPQLDTGHSSP